MESLIEKLPYSGFIIAICVVVLGASAGVYMFDSYRDKKKIKQDSADDRLIGILEKTVNEMKAKVEQLEKRERELTVEVAELRKDNEKLVLILQGRDEQTIKFYNEFADMVQVNKKTYDIVENIGKKLLITS